MIWFASAALAGDVPCAVRPDAARHVWAMTDDGRDEAGTDPGSAAGGAWFDRREARRVLVLPGGRDATFEVTNLVVADAWTIEGTVYVPAPPADDLMRHEHHLLRLVGVDETLTVDVALTRPGLGEWRIGTSSSAVWPTAFEQVADRFVSFRVVHTPAAEPTQKGSVCLWVGGTSAGCVEGLSPGFFDLTVGPAADDDHTYVYLDDLALYAAAISDDWATEPRCSAATEPREIYTSVVRDRFSLDGNYLVIGGLTTDAPAAVRHRLVLAPKVELSRSSSVRAQIRTLETRWIDVSGSAWRGSEPGSQTLSDVGVVVDLAWLARYLRNPRFVPLHFAGGRLPRTFGLGTAHQNSVGSLEPSPVSPTWIYGRDPLRRPFGDPMHLEETDGQMLGSSIDGIQLTLGPSGRMDRVGSTGITLVVGRRRPFCAGRLAEVCDEAVNVEPVYEAALVSDIGHRRDAPSPSTLEGVGSGAWIGVDLSVQLPLFERPAFTGVVSTHVQTAMDKPFAVRLAGEGQVRTGLEDDAVAPEFRGSLVGGIVDLELVAQLGFGELVFYGGTGTALSGWNDRSTAAFHPDFDVDLVGFGQLVAAASALAVETDAEAVPSWGGLYEGSYVRYGPTLQFRVSGTWQIPVRIVHAFLRDPVGDLDAGSMGTEVDAAILAGISDWRFGLLGGVLRPQNLPGADTFWLGGAKLGRDF